MSRNSELLPGWAEVTISDLATIRSGVGFPKYLQGQKSGEWPLAKVSDISLAVREANGLLLTAANYISSEDAKTIRAVPFPPGTILFAKIGEAVRLNRRAVAQVPVVADNNVMGLTPSKFLEGKYLYYYMRTVDLYEYAQATTVPSVRKSDIETVSCPLPPLAEQGRIVAAIEEQFSRLDAGVAALERVRANLKRYRTAVLKAAVEGRLTEAWRRENPDVEAASKLLERALRERRELWEREQIASYVAKGKKPPKNWQSKYKEPAEPVLHDPPLLPQGWSWSSLAQCSHRITDGTHQPPQFTDEGVPFVFVRHIVGGSITFENIKFISERTYRELNSRCPVEVGDVLYSAVGSYGVAVPVKTDDKFSFQRHIAHIKPAASLAQDYLVTALNSPVCMAQAHKVARGVAQKTVTLGDLSRFAIPIPPIEEQEHIAREVARRVSVIEVIEATLQADLRRAERLRQSILKRAFEGKLVPQDPSDEPASELLERIRKERERSVPQKKGRRKKPPRVAEGPQGSLFTSLEGRG